MLSLLGSHLDLTEPETMYRVVVVFPFSRSSTLLSHSITLKTLLISENLLSTLSISLSSLFSFSQTLICNEKEMTSWLY